MPSSQVNVFADGKSLSLALAASADRYNTVALDCLLPMADTVSSRTLRALTLLRSQEDESRVDYGARISGYSDSLEESSERLAVRIFDLASASMPKVAIGDEMRSLRFDSSPDGVYVRAVLGAFQSAIDFAAGLCHAIGEASGVTPTHCEYSAYHPNGDNGGGLIAFGCGPGAAPVVMDCRTWCQKTLAGVGDDMLVDPPFPEDGDNASFHVEVPLSRDHALVIENGFRLLRAALRRAAGGSAKTSLALDTPEEAYESFKGNPAECYGSGIVSPTPESVLVAHTLYRALVSALPPNTPVTALAGLGGSVSLDGFVLRSLPSAPVFAAAVAIDALQSLGYCPSPFAFDWSRAREPGGGALICAQRDGKTLIATASSRRWAEQAEIHRTQRARIAEELAQQERATP